MRSSGQPWSTLVSFEAALTRTQGAAALDEDGQADKALGADILGKLDAEEHQV